MDPLWVFFLLVLHVSVCGADGTSSPPTIPSRGLFSGFSPAQPFYVGSGTIGTSYPDVGVILMSWTYARDVMVHNKPVYALATQLALKHVHESGMMRKTSKVHCRTRSTSHIWAIHAQITASVIYQIKY